MNPCVSLSSEECHLSEQWARLDVGNGESHGHSENDPIRSLADRILGHKGEIVYRKLFNLPLLYHDSYDIDIKEHQIQIRTRRGPRCELYVRKEDLKQNLTTPYILITPMESCLGQQPTERYCFKGWALLNTIVDKGRWDDLYNGREKLLILSDEYLSDFMSYWHYLQDNRII